MPHSIKAGGAGCARPRSGGTGTGVSRCGRPGRLEGHHEPPLRDGADPYNLDGIVTLCSGCHIERHRSDRPEDPERELWRAYVAEIMGS